jgi:hypothetical protein
MKLNIQDFFMFPLPQAVAQLPILICQLNTPGVWPDFLDALANITGSKPAQWPQRPWFDQNGNGAFPLRNEEASRCEWANPYNQKQLRDCDLPDLLIPANASDQGLQTLLTMDEGEEVFVTRLPQSLRTVKWLLFALHEEWVCFAVDPPHHPWVAQLTAWCADREIESVKAPGLAQI